MLKTKLTTNELPIDITTIHVAPNLTPAEQRTSFVSKAKNLNHFRVQDAVIHAVYRKDGPTLSQCLQSLFALD